MMMMMMWGVTLIFASYLASQVVSQEIEMKCHKFHDFPPDANNSPSVLADLKVQLVGENDKLNISWAINIDGSTYALTGTRIVISGEPTYHCEYNPPLSKANHSQMWFHFTVNVRYGSICIQVANLPLPPLMRSPKGSPYKNLSIRVPRRKPKVVNSTTIQPPLGETLPSPSPTDLKVEADPGYVRFPSIVGAIFGGLTILMILSSFYIIYKHCGARFTTSVGFNMLPTSLMNPVPVLVVYPAENSSFQQAVVALAEFLQCHGGCSVAFDMWQQGKIAELGPMRWLSEQAKAADRVLIVCPQGESSSHPSNSAGPSIPAAAYDLYPLILNMVASGAKSASDLAKFSVVQLTGQQAKSNLPLELRVCKTFCLMKDLLKLCKSLHKSQIKLSDLMFRSGMEKNAVKLREAVETLGKHQSSISREVEPLKSVVTKNC